MPIFEYKDRDARAEVSEAFHLAAYTIIPSIIQSGGALDFSSDGDGPLPPGWRDLTAAELGLSSDTVDRLGFFTGSGSKAAQAKILGCFDDKGNLTRISVSFAGTNDLGDLPDYLKLVQGAYMDEFRYLLDATAAFAQANKLSGSDVVVTGYSLGGGATNILAERAEDFSEGFYASSNFFGFSSPTIYDNSDRILNFGAENDVVYRVVGDSDDSVKNLVREALINEDKEFGSSSDNVVLFNDFYASQQSPFGPFGILNLIGGWNAHLTRLFDPVIDRIGASSFYDIIETDSTVVVSQLSGLTRGSTWVGDVDRPTSSHFGDPAFILGTAKGDLLRDGRSGDYLDGFGGDDRFRLSSGSDTVHGGEGFDTVELAGTARDYSAYRLSDGTVYMLDRIGESGLEELVSVEQIQFGELFAQTYAVRQDRLDSSSFFAPDIRYAGHREGTAGKDTLSGTGGADAIFALGGNDTVKGGNGNDLIHGGKGNDILRGDGGDDRLFGGLDEDRLTGGAGNDILTGGAGDDVFDFVAGVLGRDTIADFNAGAEGHDVLAFDASLFDSAQDALAAFRQIGDDAVLKLGSASITLTHFNVDDLSVTQIQFA